VVHTLPAEHVGPVLRLAVWPHVGMARRQLAPANIYSYTPTLGAYLAANAGPRVPSGGVTLKRRCTYRPSVISLIVNKLLSLSLSLWHRTPLHSFLSVSLAPCIPLFLAIFSDVARFETKPSLHMHVSSSSYDIHVSSSARF